MLRAFKDMRLKITIIIIIRFQELLLHLKEERTYHLSFCTEPLPVLVTAVVAWSFVSKKFYNVVYSSVVRVHI